MNTTKVPHKLNYLNKSLKPLFLSTALISSLSAYAEDDFGLGGDTMLFTTSDVTHTDASRTKVVLGNKTEYVPIYNHNGTITSYIPSLTSIHTALLTNLTDGEISETSTDAINGSQLYKKLNSLGLNFTDGTTTVFKPNESTVSIKGSDNVNVTLDKDNGYTVSLKDNIKVNSVNSGIFTTTNGNVSISDANVKFGGNTVSGVGMGSITSTSQDAVNGSQVFNISSNLANDVLGGSNVKVNADGTITTNNIGGTGQNTIDSAIEYLNNKKADLKLGVLANNKDETELTNNSKVSFNDGLNTTVTKTVSDTGEVNIAYNLNKDISVDSLTTSNKKVSISDNGISTGGTKITNLGDGEVSATSTDAINGKQLYEAGALNVKYDTSTKDKITLNAGGDTTKITNLTNGSIGTSSTDAVNGSQVYNVIQNVANVIGGKTKVNESNQIVGYDIGGTGKSTVDEAIRSITENEYSFTINDKTKDNIVNNTVSKKDDIQYLGDNKNISVTLTNNPTGNATLNTYQNNYVITTKLSDDLDVNSVTAKSNINVGDNIKITNNGISTGGTKITSLGDGEISATSTDAINGKQLYEASSLNVKYDSASKDTITLNSGGKSTKITNLTNGAINGSSTDAVNGSQIYNATLNTIKNAIGGTNTTVGSDGSIITNNVGGTGQNTIDSAIQYLNNKKMDVSLGVLANNKDETELKNNSKISFNDGLNTTVTKTVSSNGDVNVAYNLNKDISIDSLTTSNKTISISDNGISTGGTKITNLGDGEISATSTDAINGKQLYETNSLNVKYDSASKDKITLNSGGKSTSITNVANGNISKSSTDAINGSQVYSAAASLANNVIGGSATVNNAGNVVTSNIGGTGKNTIDSAIEYLNNKKLDYNFTVSDSNSSYNVANTNSVKFVGDSKGNVNVKLSNDGQGNNVITTSLSDNINVQSLNASKELTVANKVSINDNGINVNGGVINGLNTINDIDDTNNDSMAVNVETLRNSLKGTGLVQQNDTTREITIGSKTDGDRITVSNANGETRNIGGVSNAVYDDDAVNYKQLKGLGKELNDKIADVDEDARAGIAGAVAAAALPQVYEYGRNMAAVAVGHYKGKQALAVGFSATTDNGKHIVKFTGSVSANDGKNASIGAGYGYMW